MENDRGSGADGDAIDRRSMLTKAVVAGAVAWTAPVVLSTRVAAQEVDVCTPKCAPALPATLTAGAVVVGCSGGNDTTFQVSVNLIPTSAICPCDGTASYAPNPIITGEFSSATTAEYSYTHPAPINVTCPDRSPDDGACVVPATLSLTVDVVAGPSGHCRQALITVTDVTLTPA